VFAVAVWGYAVMSNHLHVMIEVIPQVAAAWSADEVAVRWCHLYPRQNQDANARPEVLAGNACRIKVLRGALAICRGSCAAWPSRLPVGPIANMAARVDSWTPIKSLAEFAHRGRSRATFRFSGTVLDTQTRRINAACQFARQVFAAAPRQIPVGESEFSDSSTARLRFFCGPLLTPAI